MIRFLFSLFLIFSITSSQDLHQTFSKICLKHNIVGGTLFTYNDGKEIINHYGVSNIKTNQRVDNNTLYKVASISKLITALGVMKLYEDGMIDINNNINDYLDFDISNPTQLEHPITVKMLLNHTSSLTDSGSYFELLKKTQNINQNATISSLFNDDSSYRLFLNYAPGTYFSYSNINYGLLGVIIEQVTKKRFDQYIYETILSPLKIKGGFNINKIDYNHLSTLYRDGNAQIDHFLEKKTISFDSYIIGENTLLFSPHSGCRISVSDLFKIMELFLNKGKYFDGVKHVALVQDRTIDLMMQSNWKYNGLNGDNFFGIFNQWGLGLQITENKICDDFMFNNQRMYGHIGQAYGLVGSLFFNVERQNGFIFILNGHYNQQYIEGENSSFFKINEEIFNAIEASFREKMDKIHTPLGLRISNLKAKRLVFLTTKSGNRYKTINFK